MRILFLTNIPSPYRVEFFNKLSKKVSLEVIFEEQNKKWRNEKWIKGNKYEFSAFFTKNIFWVLNHIRKFKKDKIFVTNYSTIIEMMSIIYMKAFRIPYYFEIDGGMIKKENIFKKYFKIFLISGAHKYFSTSDMTDNYLIYYGAKKEKIFRYYLSSINENDLAYNKISNNEKEKLKKKLNIGYEKVIISVGQFIYRKGYDILLESARKIESNIGIYIIGGVPPQEYLDFKKQNNLYNVEFINFLEKSKLREYYLCADLFVFPTREDIWGLVIIEAMSYGLPIITTENCLSGRELVFNNQNGFIVPIEDPKTLAKKIVYILKNDSLRKTIATNNFKKAKKITIESMVDKHLALLK